MEDAGLIISYVLIGVCVLAALGLPLVQALGNPQSLKKMGISIGGLIVLFVICYFVAGDYNYGNEEITGSEAKAVGAGIIMFYVILVITIVSIVYTEISKLSK